MYEIDQIVRWRSEARRWTRDKVITAFDTLLADVSAVTATAGWPDVTVGRKRFLKTSVEPLVDAWQRKQLARIRYHLEETFEGLARDAGFSDHTQTGDRSDHFAIAAAAAFTVAPLAAVPLLGGAVTVGTTGLIFTTTVVAINWPLAMIGGVAASALFLLGRSKRGKLLDKHRAKLLTAIEKDLRKALIGGETSVDPSETFLGVALDQIDRIAQSRIEELR